MIIVILPKIWLVGCTITFGNRSGNHSLQSTSETRVYACMLHSGESYQPETVSGMSSQVNKLLKAWMEESRKQELR